MWINLFNLINHTIIKTKTIIANWNLNLFPCLFFFFFSFSFHLFFSFSFPLLFTQFFFPCFHSCYSACCFYVFLFVCLSLSLCLILLFLLSSFSLSLSLSILPSPIFGLLLPFYGNLLHCFILLRYLIICRFF